MSKNSSKNKVNDVKTIIKPLGDRVLLKKIEDIEKKTTGGILLPSSMGSDNSFKKGKIVSVGDGKMTDGKLIKPQVSVGDIVLYSWGDDLKLDGQEFVLVSADNVTAVFE
jgi:chaperonin GroES